MHIAQIEALAFKTDYHYQIGGHAETPNRFPGTDYYLEPQWPHAYSRKAEACIVKVPTATGLIGWGEASAPLIPETTCSLIANLVGPAALGQDPLATEAVYQRLYHLMDVRGHTSSFMIDAIAAIDIALWDIKGKHYQAPVCDLLGGPLRAELPSYVSGLRQSSLDERCRAAEEKVSEGFAGVKMFIGKSVGDVADEFRAVSEAVGDNGFVAVDLIHKYSVPEALRLGRTLDELQAAWLEAPVAPDDVAGHAELVRRLRTPVAIGEHLRTVQQFKPWFDRDALGIAQPDVPRTGITGAKKIAELAAAHQRQVGLHIGVFTAIGMAATWQTAAALPNFLVQEHQLDLFGPVNKILKSPLEERNGLLQVPTGPGLGVEVDEPVVLEETVEHWVIDENGKRREK